MIPSPCAASLRMVRKTSAFGPDVYAPARLVHQKHLGSSHQRLADHDLLLISARQRRDRQRGVGDLDRQLA